MPNHRIHPDGSQRLNISLPLNVYRLLVRAAAASGLSMNRYITAAVHEKILAEHRAGLAVLLGVGNDEEME